jgi:hypothetical protein
MFGLGGRKQPAQGPRLDVYAGTVEQMLLNLGIDPTQARLPTQEGYGWNFRRGSAIIEVYITQNAGIGYLQVLSPIMHLPSQGLLPLYRRLLELNLQLVSASFGVWNDVIYVFSERPLDGLDAVEANTIINQVAEYADEMDDKLIEEFGGRMYARI